MTTKIIHNKICSYVVRLILSGGGWGEHACMCCEMRGVVCYQGWCEEAQSVPSSLISHLPGSRPVEIYLLGLHSAAEERTHQEMLREGGGVISVLMQGMH